jgi:hypothetical protein
MSILRDKEVRAEKRRIEAFVTKWIDVLGLGSWQIVRSYTVTPLAPSESFSEGDTAVADVVAHWEYKRATVRFYLLSTVDAGDDEMEMYVVHELVHCVVCETRACQDAGIPREHRVAHEERVVVELTAALLRMDRMARRKPKLRKGPARAASGDYGLTNAGTAEATS